MHLSVGVRNCEGWELVPGRARRRVIEGAHKKHISAELASLRSEVAVLSSGEVVNRLYPDESLASSSGVSTAVPSLHIGGVRLRCRALQQYDSNTRGNSFWEVDPITPGDLPDKAGTVPTSRVNYPVLSHSC